jgi:hypothetical protein
VNLGFALQQGGICIALDVKSKRFVLQQGKDCNASTIFAMHHHRSSPKKGLLQTEVTNSSIQHCMLAETCYSSK